MDAVGQADALKMSIHVQLRWQVWGVSHWFHTQPEPGTSQEDWFWYSWPQVRWHVGLEALNDHSQPTAARHVWLLRKVEQLRTHRALTKSHTQRAESVDMLGFWQSVWVV
jgi:hypothetical protein